MAPRRLLIAGLLLLGLPSSASAATVRVAGHAVVYDAPGTEINAVSVSAESRSELRVGDRVPLTAGNGCRVIDQFHTTCTPPAGAWQLDVHTGRGNDSVSVSGLIFSARIAAGRGNDLVNAETGHHTVAFGGPGTDQLTGSPNTDQLSGGTGNDTVLGGPGEDVVFGGAGRDRLFGGDGFDQLDARDGSGPGAADRVDCGPDGDVADGRRAHQARAAGADVFTDCENLYVGLPQTYVTLTDSPLTTEAFNLSFSCPRRTFRLGCTSAVVLTHNGTELASTRRRLPNGKETLVSAPLTPAGREAATRQSPITALARVTYRAGHEKRSAAFRLHLP